MTATALIFCALIGVTSETTVTPADLATYQTVKAHAGRDADSQIKLALWCEAHGLHAERVKHLALAVLSDPKNATARGLMGLVDYAGRWRSPDEVSRSVREDAARAELSKKYNDRRAATPNKADALWELAVWCERNGLQAEAEAHFRAVVRLDPGRDPAWKRLGYHKDKGRWVNEEQVAAARAEAEAQKAAERVWKPLLQKSWEHLNSPSRERREEAHRALDAIRDPRAVPVVWSLFGQGKPAQQLEAVGILSRIDGPGAARGLAVLAVLSRDPEVRRRASEALPRRDAREFADLLVSLLREPIKFEVKPVDGPGSTGELRVAGKSATIKRLYSAPTPPSILPGDVLSFDRQGLPVVERPGPRVQSPTFVGIGVPPLPGERRNESRPLIGATTYFLEQVVPIGRMALDARNAAQTAAAQLEGDVEALERYNEPIVETNARSIALLKSVSGRDHGDDLDAWRSWSTDLMGYAFLPQQVSQEAPTLIEQVPINYQPQAMPALAVAGTLTQVVRHSCFAAGTMVRTLEGLRRIETIEAGDQVLVADPKSGALRFQPVLTVYHNPPNATLRVNFGDESIVATGIHRFWKAGEGWAMARDLKPGDRVRTLDGVATVSAVTPDQTQTVFNLEVASGQSFFVGRAGTLVHDNSLVLPVSQPFDAPLAGLSASTVENSR